MLRTVRESMLILPLLEYRHAVSTVQGCEPWVGEVLRRMRRRARLDLPPLPSHGLQREELLLVVWRAAH